ncbi:methyl-CpG-binding domain protein 2-like [Motacilla alba alba]|uniref:methyl-CpG-binding domain protein 2-like n=1 Tax=Motacilla alba alba TaxID=1094192 RepID=UPI0018D50A37|nr:methyl-CpG-binding domain protein 2-like [Motacilla alba alba]
MLTTHPRDLTDRPPAWPQPPLSCPFTFGGVFIRLGGWTGGISRASAVPPLPSLQNARPDALKGQNICGGGNEGREQECGNGSVAGRGSGRRGTRGPARRGPAMAAALRAGSCLETAGAAMAAGKGRGCAGSGAGPGTAPQGTLRQGPHAPAGSPRPATPHREPSLCPGTVRPVPASRSPPGAPAPHYRDGSGDPPALPVIIPRNSSYEEDAGRGGQERRTKGTAMYRRAKGIERRRTPFPH